jgi:hypothetical protein
MNNDGLNSSRPNDTLEDASRELRASQSSNPGILALDRIQSGSEMELDVGEGESLDGIDQQAKLSYVPVAEEGQQKEYTGNRFIGKKSKKRIIAVGGVAFVLMIMVAGLTLGGFFRDKEEPIRPVSNISSEDLAKLSEKDVQDANQVTINGALQLNSRFVVTPSAKPQNAEAGQIYYDKETNKFLYYDGQQYQGITNDQSFDQLTAQLNQLRSELTDTSRSSPGTGLALVGGVMSNAGVLSIQGSTGNVAFSAGQGIGLQGLTVTNTGVTALAGTANQVSVSATNGAVTLSLPQNISVASSPSFAGITLASALGISSGGTGSSSYTSGGMIYFNGTSFASTAAPASNGLCLVSTPSGPAFGSCSGAPTTGIGGSGTPGRLSYFDTANSIADSLLQQTGANIALTGGGTLSATNLQGNGAAITALNAGNIATGTLGVARGGTGANTFTANSIILGDGTNALKVSNAPSAGYCFMGNVSGAPTFQACPVGGNISSSGSQTAGRITKFDATTNTITNSIMSEASTTVSVGGTLSATNLSGAGASITGLDASNLLTGTVSNSLLTANVTLQGNTFNGSQQLLRLDASGQAGSNGLCLMSTNSGTGTAFQTCPGSGGIGVGSVSAGDQSITIGGTAGAPTIAVNVQSNMGLVTTANGLGLMACSNGEILKYNGSTWGCAADSDTVAGGDVLQGGNSFSQAMTIGTNDSYALNLETAGTARMTILANGNIGIGEINPSAKLHVNGGSMLVQGTFGGGNGITATGAGTRMFFDTNKAAFRAGDVTGNQWNDASVGAYSVAMGQDTTASGMYSTALGYGTTASGHYSTALGFNATAQSFASTVVGRYNLIQGNASGWTAADPLFVVGNGADASNRSNALTVLKNGNMLVGGSEIQKTGSSFSLNILDAGDSTLAVTNSGAGVANLNIAKGALQTAGITRITNNGTLQNINIIPNSTVTVGNAMGILFTNSSGVIQSLSVSGQTGNCVGYDGSNVVFQGCSGSGGGGTGFNNGGNNYTNNPGTATTRIATSYDAAIANPVLGLSSNSALDIITNNNSRINISNAGDVKILSNSGNSTEKLSVRTQNTGNPAQYINSLHVDTSSDTLGRVGVGIKVGSAPQVRLDIGGNFTGSGSTSNGGIQIGASAAPGASIAATLGAGSVATGRIYFDEVSGKFKVSENGSSYVDLVQGGGVAAFTRNGNSFGALATLGTTDSYDLRVVVNNSEKLRFDTSNNITFKTSGVVDFNDASGNNTLLRVDRNGNSVLVGTTSSQGGTMLNVGGNVNSTGYKINGNSGLTLSCGSGNQALGAFSFTGGILTGGSCQPNNSDLAEAYNSPDNLAAGELVMAAGTSVTSVNRAMQAGKHALMGVVSTAPSQTLGTAQVPDGYPIALTGRVPTKVTTESGAIAVGDKITISSIPGVGKKATAAGMVVGTAMESYNGTGVGSIEVFVHLMYYSPVDGNHLQAESGVFENLNVSGEATIEKLTVTGTAKFKGNIVVEGHIVTGGAAATIQVEGAAGTGATVTVDGNDTAGTITLTTGSGSITQGDLAKVMFNDHYTKVPKIVLSGQDDASLAARIFPSGKSVSSFKLKTEQVLMPNTVYAFDYVIVE